MLAQRNKTDVQIRTDHYQYGGANVLFLYSSASERGPHRWRCGLRGPGCGDFYPAGGGGTFLPEEQKPIRGR